MTVKYFHNVSVILSQYFWNINIIFQEYYYDVLAIFPQYSWNITTIFQKYRKGIFPGSPRGQFARNIYTFHMEYSFRILLNFFFEKLQEYFTDIPGMFSRTYRKFLYNIGKYSFPLFWVFFLGILHELWNIDI